MHKFRDILFVCHLESNEDSNASTSLDQVLGLARSHGARVTLAAFAEEVPRRTRKVLSGVMPVEEFERLVAHKQREKLEQLEKQVREAGVETESRLLEGRRFIAVIREVLQRGHDLVVKTRDSAEGAKERLGSDDLHLLRKCPCPVLVMRPGDKFQRILAAVDPDPEEREQLALSERVLSLAADLAAIHASELHVVHAWDFLGEELLYEGCGRLAAREVEALLERQEKLHREAFEDILENYEQDARPQRYLRRGAAGSVISSVADEVDADLVVLGTIGRTGIRGFFIGNTAESVIRQVPCSVLAIKPLGFESPVSEE